MLLNLTRRSKSSFNTVIPGCVLIKDIISNSKIIQVLIYIIGTYTKSVESADIP